MSYPSFWINFEAEFSVILQFTVNWLSIKYIRDVSVRIIVITALIVIDLELDALYFYL